jgi:hypothetical protein
MAGRVPGDASAAQEKVIGLRAALPQLALPLIGSAIILGLFTAANPVLEDAFNRLFSISLFDFPIERMIVWPLFFTMAWSLLRPRGWRHQLGTFDGRGDLALPGVSVGSVRLSLIAFNALFALQNLMDLAWLWGLLPLPSGMTSASYAHRGAYPLIVTALLAAGFVLVALRPGSQTASMPLIRRMVVLWIAQNVLLVGNAALRTLDYIAAFSLTSWRIAALLWMGLVGFGLVLVCWRMLRDKSSAWLINANAAAALALMAACCFVDPGTVSARYNIAHASELGGGGRRSTSAISSNWGHRRWRRWLNWKPAPRLSRSICGRACCARMRNSPSATINTAATGPCWARCGWPMCEPD